MFTNNSNQISNNLNVPSTNNTINNLNSNNIDSNIVNNNVYSNSSVFNKVFNFLHGSKFYNINSKEWKNLCNCQCQINPGIYSDIPFLKAIAYLLNNTIPIAFGRQQSLFNGFQKKSQ